MPVPGPYPPTPSPSLRSNQPGMLDLDQQYAGPSKVRASPAIAPPHLPPTPPVHDDLSTSLTSNPMLETSINFAEPRYRSAKLDATRRPHSTYPSTGEEEHIYHPHRKYTDPTPQTAQYPMHDPTPMSPNASGSHGSHHQLDVDLDVYSQDYDVEDDIRQPTLSFVTTSTVDSTTSSPSISEAYAYGSERVGDGKLEHEPRIRVRANAGRQNAYSSAESSMASAPYSYHAYSDNSYHQANPPPMPVATTDIGLGLRNEYNRASTAEDSSMTSCQPISPSAHYAPNPWRSPVINRDRSHSTTSTTSISEESGSSNEDRLSVGFAHSFSYLSGSFPARQAWEEEHRSLAEPHALALVDDGRSAILDREKLEAMGGLRALGAMSENELLRLPRFTHLLLSSVGPDILTALPQLLDVVSTTLVVLDVSNNDLTELPAALQHCTSLEELNVSGNPVRQLPHFLGDCHNLRMLVADNCLLQSLPVELSHLNSLHTICIRSNRLVALPSWLCLLAHLDVLRIDNNPFAPQWLPIVAPILAATLSRSLSHRRTPSQQSLTSYSLNSSMANLRTGPPSISSFASESSASLVGADARSPVSPLKDGTPTNSSLRPTRGGVLLGKRSETPLPSNVRAANRSVTGPAPTSEFLVASERFSAGSNPRRVQSSAGHYPTDESDIESGADAKSKWGFLRKVSISRLRSEKEKSTQLSAAAAANVATMPTLPTITGPTTTNPPMRRPPLTTGWSTTMLPTRRNMETPEPPSPSHSHSHSMVMTMHQNAFSAAPTAPRNKRRSFLPIDPSPPSLNVTIPSLSPFMAPRATLSEEPALPSTAEDAIETLGDEHDGSIRAPSVARTVSEMDYAISDNDGRYARGLESIKSYLRDLYDLSLPALEPYGGFEVIDSDSTMSPGHESVALRSSVAESTRSGRHLLDCAPSRGVSIVSSNGSSERRSTVGESDAPTLSSVKRFKDDKAKRTRVIREIYETEKTYVRGLAELVQLYVKPASMPVSSSKASETVIPLAERKVVFGGIESVLVIHRDNFLPALERVVKPLLDGGMSDEDGSLSARVAHQVGEVFRTYIAYMKQYSTYINNFDNALARMKSWTSSTSPMPSPGLSKSSPGSAVGVAAVGAGLIGSAVIPAGDAKPVSGATLNPGQRKRVKQFLKRAKENPRHSQINLESYLLLPVQRIPRYKLLLEDLAMCTPPRETIGPSDALDDAINEIAKLASLMNEEKREAESRLRLLAWQQRITSRGPSPLVQPHRKLVLDGALQLIRVVKKASAFVEVDTSTALKNADGESTITLSKAVVPTDYINAEPMDKPIMLILCSDMLVLVQKRSNEGWHGPVDLFNVLRMATLREPASVSVSNDRVLRVVDNKSIYYFNGGSHSTTLQWCRAINQQNRR